MKVTEGSQTTTAAKFWALCETLKPWNQENRKYFVVSIFVWLIYSAVYYESDTNKDKNSQEKDISISIASMEPLLKIEQKLVQALNEHANQLQHKVDTIRRGIACMRKPQFVHRINEEEFLSNPFNSFPMLRRLKHEWKAWEKFLNLPEKRDWIEEIHNTLANFSDFDLTESVMGVQRLREMYDIPPNDWTDGKLHFGEYEIHFSSLDCYAVGFLLYKSESYEPAQEWLKAALDSYIPKAIYKYMGYNKSVIYETYVDVLVKQNLNELALQMAEAGLRKDASNIKLKHQKIFIGKINATKPKIEPEDIKIPSELEQSIKRGCRGEYASSTSSQLSCFYNSTTNDFLRLAPFKIEELNLDPILLLYHDIITDDEIDAFKTLAKEKLQRTSLRVNKTKQSISARRTSKNAWIANDQSNLTLTLNKRIEDMTGLLPWSTEIFIGNYGLGGHFDLHKDCTYSCENSDQLTNCNQAFMTVLIYLTSVEAGGSTIFPQLEVAVKPEKATAVVWYNLHGNVSTCDERTKHLACPVLLGTKWFFIKWLRFNDQMFRKPCFS